MYRYTQAEVCTLGNRAQPKPVSSQKSRLYPSLRESPPPSASRAFPRLLPKTPQLALEARMCSFSHSERALRDEFHAVANLQPVLAALHMRDYESDSRPCSLEIKLHFSLTAFSAVHGSASSLSGVPNCQSMPKFCRPFKEP